MRVRAGNAKAGNEATCLNTMGLNNRSFRRGSGACVRVREARKSELRDRVGRA